MKGELKKRLIGHETWFIYVCCSQLRKERKGSHSNVLCSKSSSYPSPLVNFRAWHTVHRCPIYFGIQEISICFVAV
jgi:hypothetical protein